jgi:hypothetical protein
VFEEGGTFIKIQDIAGVTDAGWKEEDDEDAADTFEEDGKKLILWMRQAGASLFRFGRLDAAGP